MLSKFEQIKNRLFFSEINKKEFYRMLNELVQLKEILSADKIKTKKLKGMLKQRKYSLLEKIIVALNNQEYDFIRSLSKEQIEGLNLKKETIYDTYYKRFDMSNIELNPSTIERIKKKISKIESLSKIEQEYILKYLEMLEEWDSIREEIFLKEIYGISEAILFKTALVCQEKSLLESDMFIEALLMQDTKLFTIKDKIKCFIFILNNKLPEMRLFDLQRVLIEFIIRNEEIILETFRNDKDVEQKYFKALDIYWDRVGIQFIKEGGIDLFGQNEEFKKNIYNATNAYESRISGIAMKKFFENLPEQFKHLIAYFSPDEFEVGYEKCEVLYKRIYKKYYFDKLQEDEIEQLIKYMESIDLSKIYGEYNIITGMENIEFILKKLDSDEQFFKKITKIKDLYLDGSLYDAINFAIKYSQTKLFKYLFEVQNIDKDLKEKIVYLAKNYKIIEIETLEQVNSMTIEELKILFCELPELSELTKDSMLGTGRAEYINFQIFNAVREILIIGKDNTFEHKEAPINHGETLQFMYRNKMKLEYSFAYKMACQVCRELNDIILITEGETLFIYLPDKITKMQKLKFIELIESIKEFDKITLGLVIINDEKEKIIDIKRNKKGLLTSTIFDGNYVQIQEDSENTDHIKFKDSDKVPETLRE